MHSFPPPLAPRLTHARDGCWQSPRTADKIAQCVAYSMMDESKLRVSALKHDKKLAKDLIKFEEAKERRNAELAQKIVMRQRDVHSSIEQRQRELCEQAEREKQDVRYRIIESMRQQEYDAQRSARKAARKEASLYRRHIEETERRRKLQVKMAEEDEKRRQQYLKDLDAAEKRVQLFKKEQAVKFASERQLFKDKRDVIMSRKVEDNLKQEKGARDFRRREAQSARAKDDFEAKRSAEWRERRAEAEEMLWLTIESHNGAIAERLQKCEHRLHEQVRAKHTSPRLPSHEHRAAQSRRTDRCSLWVVQSNCMAFLMHLVCAGARCVRTREE